MAKNLCKRVKFFSIKATAPPEAGQKRLARRSGLTCLRV
jgi:hypothetical protein